MKKTMLIQLVVQTRDICNQFEKDLNEEELFEIKEYLREELKSFTKSMIDGLPKRITGIFK